MNRVAQPWGIGGRLVVGANARPVEPQTVAYFSRTPAGCEDRDSPLIGGRGMSVLIRPARAAEAKILSDLALRSKAHWGYDAEFLDACKDELTVDAGEVARRRAMVADRDGHVLGFTTLEGEPPTGTLGMMFVEPQAIGQGIGRLLFERTVAAGRELGFARLTIDADPNAEPFYRAMGATRIGSTPSGSIAGRVLPQLVIAIQS